MANPLQRASVRRKVIYAGVILGLFTLSLVWRGKVSVPLSDTSDNGRVAALNEVRRLGGTAAVAVPAAKSAVHGLADWLQARTIEEQAKPTALDLRELDQGDTEIMGAGLRLGLVGSRGLVLTALWRAAIEKQKRNEFQEFEQLVKYIIRLQPNFLTPWLYQSWNLAYNVSVENDRLNDMYYYISRGIELLAEGERLNRNSPDMRYTTGFYYANKFGVSDKVITLRSLFQLSCIKPSERDPKRFKTPDGTIRTDEFRDFVRKNPQLVRRLRDKLGYTRPEQVVRFLEDNQKVPTRFDPAKQDSLLSLKDQFPALPIRDSADPGKNLPAAETDPRGETDDTFDAFLAARAWYAYSLLVVPPASAEPSATPRLEGADRFRYRIPKQPMLIIFRQQAPRAQTYYAERLSKEGWFDADTRWNPDERADTDDQLWFPRERPEDLRSPANARAEWDAAYNRWKEHGTANGLDLNQAQLTNYARQAVGVPPSFNLGWLDYTDAELRASGVTRDQVKARAALMYYDQNRNVTNFAFFLESSNAERDPQVVAARTVLARAERAKAAGDKAEAVRLYAEGNAAWRKAVLRYPRFLRGDRSDKAQEDTFEFFIELVNLIAGTPQVDAAAQQQAVAVRAVVPGLDEGELKLDLVRAEAEREAGFRLVQAGGELDRRVDDILAKNHPTRGQEKEWPEIAAGRAALVKAVYEREFAWQAEFTDRNLKDDSTRWTPLNLQNVVRERLGLKRKDVPQPQEPVPASAPADAPPVPPLPAGRQN